MGTLLEAEKKEGGKKEGHAMRAAAASTQVAAAPVPSTLYILGDSQHQPKLMGCYMRDQTGRMMEGDRPVYRQVQGGQYVDGGMYLFYHTHRWLIGPAPGSDRCFIYAADTAGCPTG